MPTRPLTCRFASVTYALPGPTIRSTRGTERVPNARAPTACAPPLLTTSVAPALRAAYRTAAGTEPSACGGVHRTLVSTPATTAGTTVMHTDEGYTARPPGHVAADGAQRPDDLAEGHAVALVGPLAGELPGVQVVQAFDQGVERVLQIGGGVELARRRARRR